MAIGGLQILGLGFKFRKMLSCFYNIYEQYLNKFISLKLKSVAYSYRNTEQQCYYEMNVHIEGLTKLNLGGDEPFWFKVWTYHSAHI